jgi:hypothetical protein
MHLWHDWTTVEKFNGTATLNGYRTRWRDETHSIVMERQRCAKCGAERGRIHMLNGEVRTVDSGFIPCSNAGIERPMKPQKED